MKSLDNKLTSQNVHFAKSRRVKFALLFENVVGSGVRIKPEIISTFTATERSKYVLQFINASSLLILKLNYFMSNLEL
jgi:hypothetical protein